MKKKFLELPVHHRIFFATVALAVVLAGTFAGIFYARKAFTSPAPSVPIFNPSGMKGETSGVGTHFAITDSEYLNIALDSTETVDLRLTSMPKVITMMFNPATTTSATTTEITISGLVKNTTYYKYEDDYHHLAQFTTDDNGAYSYTQDISTRHFVFIQTRKSTKFIADNETGGDCSTIGNWNQPTKTCTLTTDLTETVQIDSDGVTLDGNGHKITITPEYTVNGVYISGKASTTVKNLTVNGAYEGISLWQVSGGSIASNILTGNMDGMRILSSNDNTIKSNVVSDNYRIGISIYSSSDNKILDNTIQENGYLDIENQMYASDSTKCNNTITGNIGSGGRPIVYFNSAITLNGGTFSELILCNADNSDIRSVTVRGSDDKQNNGFFVSYTNNSTSTDITSNDNYYGISVGDSSNNNTFESNKTNGNLVGIAIDASVNNRILGNTAEENSYLDLIIYGGNIGSSGCGNTVTGNIGSGGRPIGFFNATTTLSGSTFSELILCNADHSDINGVTIDGSATKYNNGLVLTETDFSTIADINSSYNSSGIILNSSNSNTLTSNTLTNNGVGIELNSSGNNTLADNTVSNGTIGTLFASSDGNRVYNNNSINNYVQVSFASVSNANVFNLPKPIGGNYWSNYDTPEEGCNDANSDGFCDAPYVLGGDTKDNFPWTRRDGWKGKTVKVAVILAELSDVKHKTTLESVSPCKLPEKKDNTYPNGHDKSYYDDMMFCVKDYYNENSYGTVNVEAT
ncbi:MAG: NosD domain-containing protein, partial [Bacteroidota bacterium]